MIIKQVLATAGLVCLLGAANAQDWGRYAGGAVPLPPSPSLHVGTVALQTAPLPPAVLPPDFRALYESLAAGLPKQYADQLVGARVEKFLWLLREPPMIPIKGKP